MAVPPKWPNSLSLMRSGSPRNGDLYVVERDNYVVRRIDMKTGVIVTIAGKPQKNGFSGDGGPADKAQFNQPHGIAIHPDGGIYVCDVLNNRVRRVDAKTGTITTFAGNGETGHTPDGGSLTTSPIQGPRSLEITRSGKIYLALREGNAIVELDGKAGKIKRIAGTGENGYSGDGGPASRATFGSSGAGGLTGTKGLASSADGRMLYVADCENHVVRRIDLKTGIVSTVAGTGKRGNGTDGDPLQCALARPHGVYMRGKVLYIADSENHARRFELFNARMSSGASIGFGIFQSGEAEGRRSEQILRYARDFFSQTPMRRLERFCRCECFRQIVLLQRRVSRLQANTHAGTTGYHRLHRSA